MAQADHDGGENLAFAMTRDVFCKGLAALSVTYVVMSRGKVGHRNGDSSHVYSDEVVPG